MNNYRFPRNQIKAEAKKLHGYYPMSSVKDLETFYSLRLDYKDAYAEQVDYKEQRATFEKAQEFAKKHLFIEINDKEKGAQIDAGLQDWNDTNHEIPDLLKAQKIKLFSYGGHTFYVPPKKKQIAIDALVKEGFLVSDNGVAYGEKPNPETLAKTQAKRIRELLLGLGAARTFSGDEYKFLFTDDDEYILGFSKKRAQKAFKAIGLKVKEVDFIESRSSSRINVYFEELKKEDWLQLSMLIEQSVLSEIGMVEYNILKKPKAVSLIPEAEYEIIEIVNEKEWQQRMP